MVAENTMASTFQVGRVRPVYKGDWNPELSYIVMDMVRYHQEVYQAVRDVPAGYEPDGAHAFWIKTGSKGDKGDQGVPGIQGVAGKDGAEGEQGVQGLSPAHRWLETMLALQNPDGSWSDYVNLKGTQGVQGPEGPVGAQGIKGSIGPQGPAGPQGERGPTTALSDAINNDVSFVGASSKAVKIAYDQAVLPASSSQAGRLRMATQSEAAQASSETLAMSPKTVRNATVKKADSADTAVSCTTALQAINADNAGKAYQAQHAVNADYASSAINASKLEGHSVSSFAPSGFGLGGPCVNINNWDDAKASGFYMGAPNTFNEPSTNWHFGVIIQHDNLWIEQQVTAFTTENCDRYLRYRKEGVWTPWRWVGNMYGANTNTPLMPTPGTFYFNTSDRLPVGGTWAYWNLVSQQSGVAPGGATLGKVAYVWRIA